MRQKSLPPPKELLKVVLMSHTGPTPNITLLSSSSFFVAAFSILHYLHMNTIYHGRATPAPLAQTCDVSVQATHRGPITRRPGKLLMFRLDERHRGNIVPGSHHMRS